MLLQYAYTASAEEYDAVINVRRRDTFQIDSADDLHGRLQRRRTIGVDLCCCWVVDFWYPLCSSDVV